MSIHASFSQCPNVVNQFRAQHHLKIQGNLRYSRKKYLDCTSPSLLATDSTLAFPDLYSTPMDAISPQRL